MASQGHLVLAVDDDPAVAEAHAHLLESVGAFSLTETNPDRVEGRLDERRDIEMVLLDLRMPSLTGLEVLERVWVRRPEVGVVIATVVNDIEVAVRAIKLGAYNYLLKPIRPEPLCQVLDSYFANRPRRLAEDPRFASFITGCAAFEHVFRRIQSFAEEDVTVLLQGETGTGKEIVAHIIHSMSARNRGPFIPVNLAGLSTDLLGSELFGHCKGAFTGAARDHAGYFEAASGGTIFLDEVGELGLDQQAKLLRILQTRRYCRVGETCERESTARIVLATNRTLCEDVKRGRFRQDLFFRLSAYVVSLPPLRQRNGDTELLANYFLRKYCSQFSRTIAGFHPDALSRLVGHSFPGNVRELEGIVAAAVLIERRSVVFPSSLPGRLGQQKEEVTDLETLKHRAIMDALARCDGNQTKAAEKLGLSRSHLNRLLNAYKRRGADP